ncbi:hypothetical protein TWF694_002897 [Orbilia ellipsospora]|uniref:Yeast cell wall synthesis Kre9/Knh1-like N-terminal domain-containing protein n=1 Tax=Orbilia ellipsospora TaxID=2528407 RepID=A0AAV9X183_9PEZI
MRFITFLLATLMALTPSFVLAESNYNSLTAPLAGDIITAGKPFQVRWINPDGAIVNVVLLRGDYSSPKTIGALAVGISNVGVFNWNVQDALEPGTDYLIEIQSGVEKTFTPHFTVVSNPVVSSSTSEVYSLPTNLVEKTDTTDSGSVLTESYPIDATTVETETAIVTSDTSLIFPAPTEDLTSSTTGKIITLDATNTYSVTTVTYSTTKETVINGSSTTWVGNGTRTTSSLINPTSGNYGNPVGTGVPASLALVLAGLMLVI